MNCVSKSLANIHAKSTNPVCRNKAKVVDNISGKLESEAEI